MRIIIAPDSFKGCLSALQAAKAMAAGVAKVFPEGDIALVPIADGGEGTVEALLIATGGTRMEEEVTGPLGERIRACWGILGDGKTGVIELAEAAGLPLVPPESRNPALTTTFGVGELIRAALDKGLRKLIIGIGGSATNDGGSGMLSALGVKFLDRKGQPLPLGGGYLQELVSIDLASLDERIAHTDIVVACDVDNPLCGARGAAAVYGPQKGATEEMVAVLDRGLAHYAAIGEAMTGRQVADRPGAGAAGGVGAGLMLFTGAQLLPGVDIVLEATGFRQLLRQGDLVITGEGSTDFQSAFGKGPVGVARMAREEGVPVLCLSGTMGKGYESVLEEGIHVIQSITSGPMELTEALARAAELTEKAAEQMCRGVRVGMELELKNKTGSRI